jgi:ppGpp synthetase/RelA/SpoT-type nucleotidyltranferase
MQKWMDHGSSLRTSALAPSESYSDKFGRRRQRASTAQQREAVSDKVGIRLAIEFDDMKRLIVRSKNLNQK